MGNERNSETWLKNLEQELFVSKSLNVQMCLHESGQPNQLRRGMKKLLKIIHYSQGTSTGQVLSLM